MHYSLLKCFLVMVLLVNAKIFAQASCLKSYRTQITEKGTTEVKNGTHEHVVIQFDKQNLCGIGTVEVQNGVVAQIQWIMILVYYKQLNPVLPLLQYKKPKCIFTAQMGRR
ncbi:MAG: hypothetical protein EBQ77_02475 [Sphingobacteriia bacterium]|nr:hypothetical protein [Sphingobacteriia bacterium]